MKKSSSLLLAALLLCAVLLCPLLAQADFGSFSGDSDYGSSSGWDSGSSWDSGNSWDSGSSWDDDDSWGSGGSGGFIGGSTAGGDSGWVATPSGQSSGGSFASFVVPVIIVVLIIVFISRRGKNNPVMPGGQLTAASALQPMDSYAAEDAGFNASALQEKLGNLYVQMQNAWQAKDLDPLRPYLTDAFYAQMERQLSDFARTNRTNYVERISVLSVLLRGWYRSGDSDHIVAALRTRIVDYTLDDNTGAVVAGNRSRELFMEYEWDMARPTGQVTGAASEMTSVHCPSCGAPLSINHSAKCPYCDAIVTLAEHDWAIFAIKGISQRQAN
ncbi:MAG: 39S ribosomal protein L45 [Christensenellaceae bacterium]|jgi:hypothetical protein|nr:39S ribosomal protein L45 [Christensenellaceae bacterium]